MSRALKNNILLIGLSMYVGCNITLFASESDRVEVEEHAVNTQNDSDYVLQQGNQALSENQESVNEQLNINSSDRYVIDTGYLELYTTQKKCTRQI